MYENVLIPLIFLFGIWDSLSAERADSHPLPVWVSNMMKSEPHKSGTNIEEAKYKGRRVFIIMPFNRGPDTGNEDILYSEDGKIICEFGGIVGQVSSGSCDIDKIKFVRTIFPRRLR